MRKKIAYLISTASLLSVHAHANDPVNLQEFMAMQDKLNSIVTEVHRLGQNPSIPTGTVVAFAGDKSKVPDGWLLCDGSEVSREMYEELFDTIGTAHGVGDGNATFRLPDYRGLFLRGVAAERAHIIEPSAPNRMAMNMGGNTGNNVGSIQNDALNSHSHGSGSLSASGTNLNVSGEATPNQRNISTWTSGSGSHSHKFQDSFFSESHAGGQGMIGSGRTDFDNAPYKLPSETESSGSHSHSVSFSLPNYSFSFSKYLSGFSINGSTSYTGDNETRPKNAYVNYIIKI